MTETIQLFATCIIDTLYPEIGQAVVRVLERAGVRVEFPAGQTCCGQPAFNAGQRDQNPQSLWFGHAKVIGRQESYAGAASQRCRKVVGDEIDAAPHHEGNRDVRRRATCEFGAQQPAQRLTGADEHALRRPRLGGRRVGRTSNRAPRIILDRGRRPCSGLVLRPSELVAGASRVVGV